MSPRFRLTGASLAALGLAATLAGVAWADVAWDEPFCGGAEAYDTAASR